MSTQGVCLQRGVDLPSLDVTYFTSLSYYILLLFGLNGLLRMLFRDQASPCSTSPHASCALPDALTPDCYMKAGRVGSAPSCRHDQLTGS